MTENQTLDNNISDGNSGDIWYSDKFSPARKSIDHDDNITISLLCTRQRTKNINSDYLKRSGSTKQLKLTGMTRLRRFPRLARQARSDEGFDVSTHTFPIELGTNSVVGFLVAQMTGHRKIMEGSHNRKADSRRKNGNIIAAAVSGTFVLE